MTDDLVKRYDVYPAYHGVDVEECHVGEFVYYADHADRIEALTAERDRLRESLRDGRRLWAIAQDDRIRLLIQLEQCEKRHD